MNTTKSPIEQCGWKKQPIRRNISLLFYKGETILDGNCFVAFHLNENGKVKSIFIRNNEEISLEELQAIYETAKQYGELK